MGQELGGCVDSTGHAEEESEEDNKGKDIKGEGNKGEGNKGELSKQSLKRQRQKAKAALRTKLGREPTDAEVAAAQGLEVPSSSESEKAAPRQKTPEEIAKKRAKKACQKVKAELRAQVEGQGIGGFRI